MGTRATSPHSAHSLHSSEELKARSGVYRLLARLWLREADRNLLRQLRAPRLRDPFVAAGGTLPADDGGSLFEPLAPEELAVEQQGIEQLDVAQQEIEQLAIDYCRLFVGPADHLPPYQSVWQTGQFQGERTASMKTFVEVAGYDNDALPAGVMLDHLGVQLDVMGHILGEASTWPSQAGRLDEVFELARTFFAAHLLWPDELLLAAERRAATGFYRSSVAMTRDFLNLERQEFS